MCVPRKSWRMATIAWPCETATTAGLNFLYVEACAQLDSRHRVKVLASLAVLAQV